MIPADTLDLTDTPGTEHNEPNSFEFMADVGVFQPSRVQISHSTVINADLPPAEPEQCEEPGQLHNFRITLTPVA